MSNNSFILITIKEHNKHCLLECCGSEGAEIVSSDFEDLRKTFLVKELRSMSPDTKALFLLDLYKNGTGKHNPFTTKAIFAIAHHFQDIEWLWKDWFFTTLKPVNPSGRF